MYYYLIKADDIIRTVTKIEVKLQWDQLSVKTNQSANAFALFSITLKDHFYVGSHITLVFHKEFVSNKCVFTAIFKNIVTATSMNFFFLFWNNAQRKRNTFRLRLFTPGFH